MKCLVVKENNKLFKIHSEYKKEKIVRVCIKITTRTPRSKLRNQKHEMFQGYLKLFTISKSIYFIFVII